MFLDHEVFLLTNKRTPQNNVKVASIFSFDPICFLTRKPLYLRASYSTPIVDVMTATLNTQGNGMRITGHLCWESTGSGWIHRIKDQQFRKCGHERMRLLQSGVVLARPIGPAAQILQRTTCNRNVHTCAHFYHKVVYCGYFEICVTDLFKHDLHTTQQLDMLPWWP